MSILLTCERQGQVQSSPRSHSQLFPLLPGDRPFPLLLSAWGLLDLSHFVSCVRFTCKYILTLLLNCKCCRVWSMADYLLCVPHSGWNQSTSFDRMGSSLRTLLPCWFFFQALQLIFPSSFCITCHLCPACILWAYPGVACRWFLHVQMASGGHSLTAGACPACIGMGVGPKYWSDPTTVFSTPGVTSTREELVSKCPSFLSPQGGWFWSVSHIVSLRVLGGMELPLSTAVLHTNAPFIVFPPFLFSLHILSQCFLNKLPAPKFLSEGLQLGDPNYDNPYPLPTVFWKSDLVSEYGTQWTWWTDTQTGLIIASRS